MIKPCPELAGVTKPLRASAMFRRPVNLLVSSMLAGVLAAAVHSPAMAQQVSGSVVNDLEVRALVSPVNRIAYRSLLSAPVKAAPVLAGEKFAKGDLLLAFDCERTHAELAGAKASARAAQTELASKQRLLRHKAAGREEVLLAEAASEKAQAETAAIAALAGQCELHAPFDGRMAEVNVHVLELPPTDRATLVFLEDGRLELELVAPSNWLSWVRPGLAFRFHADETGHDHDAELVRTGAEIDPVSQTVRLWGRFTGETSGVLAGMSGSARFDATQ